MSPPPIPRPVRHVYLHAPFCPRRCAYCDFPVETTGNPPTEDWIAALSAELRLIEAEGRFSLDRQLDTVYVGGGTPSFLGLGAMEEVTRILGQERLDHQGLEWTVEANPDSFSADLARDWVGSGVTRVSLGVQSFQLPVLRWLDRGHGPAEARAAVQNARRAGIQELSLDLMFGLPQAVERDWNRDLEEALGLGVPHLSLYGLSVERGTPLARAMEEGTAPEPSEEQYREEFLAASERLVSEGYVHYEVSSFALPGRESMHNRAYWEAKPYLGLGNGAHSFQPPWRRWNLREWREYRNACLAESVPWEGEEELSPEESRLEELWLGLRTNKGVGTAAWNPRATATLTSWISQGYAFCARGRARLTPRGWLLLDHLVLDLDRALG